MLSPNNNAKSEIFKFPDARGGLHHARKYINSVRFIKKRTRNEKNKIPRVRGLDNPQRALCVPNNSFANYPHKVTGKHPIPARLLGVQITD